MSWYSTISKDISKIPDCIAHYNVEYQTARKECGIWGNLERSSASLPGIVEYRFQQLQEIEAILEYLHIEKRRLRSQVFKKFLENYYKMGRKYIDLFCGNELAIQKKNKFKYPTS